MVHSSSSDELESSSSVYLIPPFDVFDLLTHNDPHHNMLVTVVVAAISKSPLTLPIALAAAFAIMLTLALALPVAFTMRLLATLLASLSDFPSLLDCGSPGF